MDKLLKRLSTASGDGLKRGCDGGNALCTCAAGLSALLCEDRVILFNTNAPDAAEQTLFLSDRHVGLFTSIEFNVKGTALMLWSEQAAGIVDIYDFQRLNMNSEARIPVVLIGEHYWESDQRVRLVRARWHHTDTFSAVLLFSSAVMPLVLVDVAGSSGTGTKLPVL